MASADLRNQILENAKFLFGPKKTFQIVTACVLYGSRPAPQAVLVECNEAEDTFKTHIIAKDRQTLEEALELLHAATTTLVYEKLAQSIEEDDCLEVGETVLEGSLGWT